MAVIKSEQIMTESSKSFEDAIQVAVSRFSKTVRGIRSANINNMSVTIDGGKITSYRVNVQMAFEVEETGGSKNGKGKKKKKK